MFATVENHKIRWGFTIIAGIEERLSHSLANVALSFFVTLKYFTSKGIGFWSPMESRLTSPKGELGLECLLSEKSI